MTRSYGLTPTKEVGHLILQLTTVLRDIAQRLYNLENAKPEKQTIESSASVAEAKPTAFPYLEIAQLDVTKASLSTATITSLSIPGPAGGDAKLTISGSKIRIQSSNTPGSVGAAGSQGDISWDSGYVYVCIADNTWRRASIGAW